MFTSYQCHVFYLGTLQLQVLSTELRRLSSDLHIAVLVSNNCRYGAEASRRCLGEFWSTVPRLTLQMQPLETPLRASVEITWQLRSDDIEVGVSSENQLCIIDFREIM